MGKEGALQKINPTCLTQEQAKLLRVLLENSIDNNIFVWSPDKIYHITHSFRGITRRTPIELSHSIIFRRRTHPISRAQAFRFTVYDPYEKPISEGAYGKIFNVVGTLAPEGDDSLIFKTHKSRVIKVQAYSDPISYRKESSHDGKSKQLKVHIQNEADLSIRATHLHAKPVTFDESKRLAYIPLKKFSGMKLSDIMPRLNLNQRLLLSHRLLVALQEQIYANNIIHRDLKPENILVDEQTLCVNTIDFGLGRSKDTNDDAQCGTDGFAAPEIFRGVNTHQSDIYSMGVVLGLLWGGTFDKDVTERTRANPPRFVVPKITRLFSILSSSPRYEEAEEITALLNNMMADSPLDRPSLDEAIAVFDDIMLQHALADAPTDLHSIVTAAHDKALEVSKFIKYTASSLDAVASEIKSGVSSVADNAYAVLEFLRVVDIAVFFNLKSKNVLYERIAAITNDHKQVANTLQELQQIIASTSSAITDSLSKNFSSLNRNSRKNLVTKLGHLQAEIQLIQYKLGRRETNIDQLVAVLPRYKHYISSIESQLMSIHDELSTLRYSKRELDERLTIISSERDELGQLKNWIRKQIKDYVNEAALWSPSSFRLVMPEQRIREIHEILDIVEHTESRTDLNHLVRSRLDKLSTGLTGRSRLRDILLPTITPFDIATQTWVLMRINGPVLQ